MLELKNYIGVIRHDTEGWCYFKRKLTGGLKNYIKNLVYFHVSSHNSENLHFDWLVLSKAYKGLDQQVQKSFVSWHLKVIQIKANSCEICIFLCDAINLKQSVEGTLKVLGKS